MPLKFNPFTGNFDFVSDLSGYLPLTGGTLTGELEINYAAPELQLTTSGDSNTSRLVRTTSNLVSLYNTVSKTAGKSVTFSGTNSITLTWVSLGGSTVSFDFWFSLDPTTGTNKILWSYGAGRLIIDLTHFEWMPSVFASASSTSYSFSSNTPYHMVITQTGTTYNVYINNVQVVTSGTAAASYNNSNSGQSRLGGYTGADGPKATLDEWTAWSKVLSAAEVSASYNSGAGTYHTIGTSNMVRCMHLDEGAGTQTVDTGSATGYGLLVANSGGVPSWTATIISAAAANVEKAVIQSTDGSDGAEAGIVTLGTIDARVEIKAKTLRFYNSAGSELMRMDENGYFGFGTTQPNAPLTAKAAYFSVPAAANLRTVQIYQNDSTNNPYALYVEHNATATGVFMTSVTGNTLQVQQTGTTTANVATFQDSSSSSAGDGRVVDISVRRPGGQGLRIQGSATATSTALLYVNNLGTGLNIVSRNNSTDTFTVSKAGVVTLSSTLGTSSAYVSEAFITKVDFNSTAYITGAVAGTVGVSGVLDVSGNITTSSSSKVGAGIATPTSTLHSGGSIAGAVTILTAATLTLTASHFTVLADATSNAITVTLPAASGCVGRIYCVKKTDAGANSVTVDGNASETIDGATTYVLLLQYNSVQIISDGTNWHVIANV